MTTPIEKLKALESAQGEGVRFLGPNLAFGNAMRRLAPHFIALADAVDWDAVDYSPDPVSDGVRDALRALNAAIEKELA